MKKIKSEHSDEDIFVTCPQCKNCEQQPIDQQRWHLQSFDFLGWEITLETDDNEVSLMKCLSCNEKFELEWDYSDKTHIKQEDL